MVYNESGLEFLRLSRLTLSAADTYTEISTPTPCSKNENLAMIIHGFAWEISSALDAVGDGDSYTVQFSDRQQNQERRVDDSGLLYKMHMTFKIVTSGMTQFPQTGYYKLPKPIIYAKGNIWFGAITAGQAAAKVFQGAVMYTLEKVNKDVFIDSLVED